jgi:hypothetical protein
MAPHRPFTVAALALAALAVVSMPDTAAAQGRRGARSDRPDLRVGGAFGLDRGDWDGLGLRLDAEVDLQRLAPNLVLAGVGSLSFSHLSLDALDFTDRLDVFELVPAARFLLAIAPQAGVYGDAGLGLYQVRMRRHDLARGTRGDDSDVGLAGRIGAGGYVWASDQVRLGAELAFHPHFGDYEDTSVTLMVALMVRTGF